MKFLPSLHVQPSKIELSPLVLSNGHCIAIAIRHSARATRMALRVHPASDSVELVLPNNASFAHAEAFLAAQSGWIADKIDRFPPRIPFLDGALVPILGVDRWLTHMSLRDRSRLPFVITDHAIEVTGLRETLARRTLTGLQTHARRVLAEKTKTIAGQLGKPVGRISVGDARTRWGSCTKTGNIKYSWRLILAPEKVLDYVVAHEVAHLAELNHSERFWRVVAQLHPNFEQERAWLRRHATQLHRYG